MKRGRPAAHAPSGSASARAASARNFSVCAEPLHLHQMPLAPAPSNRQHMPAVAAAVPRPREPHRSTQPRVEVVIRDEPLYFDTAVVPLTAGRRHLA